MAFSVTKEHFDSKTIPKSYIMLRNIERLPFGSSMFPSQTVANTVSNSTPIVMIENDCLVVTGSNLLNAFDRLGIAEYSSKAIITSRGLGEMIPVNEAQVAEIEKAFNL